MKGAPAKSRQHTYDDEPLMIAHLLGGANGVDVTVEIADEEIERRVAVAVRYGRVILRQLAEGKSKRT